jgi:hypothetical protein
VVTKHDASLDVCCLWSAVLIDSKEILAGTEEGLALLESWNDGNALCNFKGIKCNEDNLVTDM